MLRIVLDVNVWVANFLAAARGRDGTCCQLLVKTVLAGHCRRGPIVSWISLAMLDSIEAVLERECDFPPDLAHASRNVAEWAGAPPVVVVGGGVQPMRDLEDIGVMETAISVGADLLVTGNIADFKRGARSRVDATVARSRHGKADVLVVANAALPRGLVVATPFAAKAWLIDGHVPPAGVVLG